MRPLLFFLLSSLPICAAIDARGLVLQVRQEQKQISQLNARTSDGRRDRSIKHVRILNVDCRYLGSGKAEPATLRWFFIGKSPVDGKFDYYSVGSDDVAIPREKPIRLRIVSDPLRQEQYVEQEFLTSVHVTAGSVPHGWVLMVVQDGHIVKQTASESGLIEWMTRNPPPRKPSADR